MSWFVVTIAQKRLQMRVMKKIVQEAFPKAVVYVVEATLPISRSERFGAAKNHVSEALSDAEELRDELQTWLKNLPENLQDGDKTSQLEEAISNLEEFIAGCEQANDVEVEFPGMY